MMRWIFSVGYTTKEEIFDYCVKDVLDRGWQIHRIKMKGLTTYAKLEELADWRAKWIRNGSELPRDVQVQIDNYINALLRGGQLMRDASGHIVVQR